MTANRSPDLGGWTPIHVTTRRHPPTVWWCRLGPVRFTDPFFEQTIARALRNPATLLFQRETPLEDLGTYERASDAPKLAGFIFHLSRCGSTLVAQMLAALPRSIVISEAPPIDQVLMSHLCHPSVTEEKRRSWLRGMIAALTQRRFPAEAHCFIKFDSWHMLELPLIRRAFPEVPWIFLYRDPVEVMVSQVKLRGAQMMPGMVDSRIFGIDPVAAMQLPIDVYGARVLARVASAGLAYAKSLGGRLINFRQLPNAVEAVVAPHFGLEFSAADQSLLRQAAAPNSKNPVLPHQNDTEAKQRAATDVLREIISTEFGPLYSELEAWRANQEASLAGRAERAPSASSAR